MLAIAEKVVLRLDDLITWITVDAEWTWGQLAKWEADVKEPKCEREEIEVRVATTGPTVKETPLLDFTDIERAKIALGKCLNTYIFSLIFYQLYFKNKGRKRIELSLN